jgi:hypothetical protein
MSETHWWENNYPPGWPPGVPSPEGSSMWEDSDGRCAYCGLDVTQDARFLALLHADHIVPKCEGGSGHPL